MDADEFAAAKRLGKEIASWEMPGGGHEYLYRKGTIYHLVTERILVRDGHEWIEQSVYIEKHPGLAGFRDACQASKQFQSSTRPLSWAEAVKWIYETLVTGMLPAEFHAEFRPQSIAAGGVQ